MRTALALILLASPTLAQDWPPEVAAIVEEGSSVCDGAFTTGPEAVTQRDLDGDGTQDWVIDSGAFQCSTGATLYCGTQGCSVDTLIDGIRTSFTLHDSDTVTENGHTYLTTPNDSGGTSRFLWGNGEWQIQ